MSAVKLAGLALVSLGGAGLGWVLSDTLVRREAALSAMLTSWRLLRARVAHLAIPLPEALREAGRAEGGDAERWMASLAERIGSSAADVGEEVAASLKAERGKLRNLTSSDIAAIAMLFETVSRSDAAGLGAAFGAGEDTLMTLQNAAALRRDKDRKLWRTMGVLGGLAAALMLW